jgi:hypothetical protein
MFLCRNVLGNYSNVVHAGVYNIVLYCRCTVCIEEFEIGSEIRSMIGSLLHITLFKLHSTNNAIYNTKQRKSVFGDHMGELLDTVL